MDAETYAFMRSLSLGVDIEKHQVGVSEFLEVATRNGMHDVWYVLVDARDNFLGDGRDHPLAEAIRLRLKNECMKYDGRDQKLYRFESIEEGHDQGNDNKIDASVQQDASSKHRASQRNGVFSEETSVARQLGPIPRRYTFHQYKT